MSKDDDPQKRFKEAAENFKKSCQECMKGQMDSWNGLIESGAKNFEALQSHYAKNYSEMVRQLAQANKQLQDQLQTQYSNLKEQLKIAYDTMMKQSQETYEKNMDTFKSSAEDALKKYPNLPPKVYTDTMKDIEQMRGKTVEEIKKAYKVLLDNLEKNYKEAKAAISLPPALLAHAPKASKSESRPSEIKMEKAGGSKGSSDEKAGKSGSSKK